MMYFFVSFPAEDVQRGQPGFLCDVGEIRDGLRRLAVLCRCATRKQERSCEQISEPFSELPHSRSRPHITCVLDNHTRERHGTPSS